MHFTQSVSGIGAAGDYVEGLVIEDELSGAGRIAFQLGKAVIDEVGGTVPEPGQKITAAITIEGDPYMEAGTLERTGRVESVSRQAIGDSLESYRVEALTEEIVLGRTRFLWTEEDTAELIEEPEDTKPWNRVPTQDNESRVDLTAVLEKVLDEYLGWTLTGVSEVWASDYVSEFRAISELCDEIARRTRKEYRVENGEVRFLDPGEGEAKTIPSRYRVASNLRVEEDLSELYNVVRAYGYEYDVLSSESPKIGIRQNVFSSPFWTARAYVESETLEGWRARIGDDWEAWDRVYIANVTADLPVAKTLDGLARRNGIEPGETQDRDKWPAEHEPAHWIPDPETPPEPDDPENPGDEYLQGEYRDGVIELEDSYRIVSGPRDVEEANQSKMGTWYPQGSDIPGRIVTQIGDPFAGPLSVVDYNPIPDWGSRLASDAEDVSNIGPRRLQARIPIRRGSWIERVDEGSISEYGVREAPPLNIDSEAPIDMAEAEAEAYLERHAQPIVRISGGLYAPIKPGERIEVDGYTAPVRSVAWSISGSTLEVNVEAET